MGLSPALNSVVSIYAFTWVERDSVCLSGAKTGTAPSRDKRINHENTVPPLHEIEMNPLNFVGCAWFKFIIYYNKACFYGKRDASNTY